jgi:hypothetical protein
MALMALRAFIARRGPAGAALPGRDKLMLPAKSCFVSAPAWRSFEFGDTHA